MNHDSRGWLLALGWVVACSSTSASVAVPPQPSGDSGAEAGVPASPRGETVEAFPSLPECPVIAECSAPLLPWDPVVLLETPAEVELRDVQGLRAIAFDRTTRSFVVYTLTVSGGAVVDAPPSASTLPPRFDRVSFAGDDGLLACAGADCIVRGETGDLPVPAELRATTAAGTCVGGAGLACHDGAGWTWVVRPEAFGEPMDHLAQFAHESFIAIGPGDRARRIRPGRAVVDFSSGLTERLERVHADRTINGDVFWSGRTESGRLVLGTLNEGRACDVPIEGVDSHLGQLFLARSGEIVTAGYRPVACTSRPVDPKLTTTGLTVAPCGLLANPLAWDAHHLYGHRRLHCAFD
ncbi:MAG: hypothetical protein KF764_28650 [Labilithrix sp.]|nr:hypothetical protein [Labilithrix sp.]